MLDYWLALLEYHGFTEVLINLHHLPEQVEAYLAQQPYRIAIRTFYEPELLGSAGTVRANREWVGGEDFLVAYADNLSTADLSGLWQFHQTHAGLLSMALFETPEPERCGIAVLDDTGRIVAFEEKPARPRSNLANAGLYVASPEVINYIPLKPVADFGFDVLPQLVGRMYGFHLTGYHYDIGTWESYEKAQREVRGLQWPNLRPPRPLESQI